MTDSVATRLAEPDRLITADREELKYLVPGEAAVAVAREVAARLPAHRFRGRDANQLPGAHHYVTTIYFDTAGRDVFGEASASPDNDKLRAKEYYDLHPDLTELATDPRELVRFVPVLWLELKLRRGTRSQKRRIGIPKRDVPGFFADGVVTPEILRIQREAYGAEGEQVIDELRGFCARLSGPLRADCLVNYRRNAWQNGEGTLRVTIDRELAFFRPPDDLWTRDHALVRATLGTPVRTEPAYVLEIKHRGGAPGWLTAALESAGAEQGLHSKFLAAARAVHGDAG